MGVIHLLLVLVTLQNIYAQRADLDNADHFESNSDLDNWGYADQNADQKIYNGDDAELNEFPFMVRIVSEYGDHWCGGALIKSRVVLTAAHCVVHNGEVAKGMKVVVGDWKIDQEEENEKEYETVRSVVHPGYMHDARYGGDIALIVLKEDVQLGDGVKLIYLPEDRSFYEAGAPVTVIGFGGTEKGYISYTLQKHESEISDQDACKDYWGAEQVTLLEGAVCTGKPPLESFAWQGDSGGPLFAKDAGGQFVLVALTSWGVNKPDTDSYDVNTDVHFYKDWIEENTEKALDSMWIELKGGLSHGVLLFHDGPEEVYTVCNQGVGKHEVDAICRHLGYSYGVLKHSVEYKKKQRKQKSELPKYGVTNLECSAEAKNVFDGCDINEYPGEATVPCFAGQEVTVQCADSEWIFAVDVIDTKVKSDGDYVKGKVDCKVDAKLYGSLIDLKEAVQVSLLNVMDDGSVQVVEENMRYRKRAQSFFAKLKVQDEIKHHCFVCVASIRENGKFFDAKVEVKDCKMDSAAALKIVNDRKKAEE